MKRKNLLLLISVLLISVQIFPQRDSNYTKIDLLLVNGEFLKVIDTCRLILSTDSMNSEIYYRMGLAYQNILPDDKSFKCFQKAVSISPDNNNYKFMLAKGFYARSKYDKAKTVLEDLYRADTLNWTYAYYLTSIMMQEKHYDEALKIYQCFYDRDSTDYVILDKIGFALLRKGSFLPAIEYFNRSLAVNRENVGSIKNLSFLYASTSRLDTAFQLLTMGLKIDPDDMDLYVRRAALNFAHNYTKRALDDYLIILASGDSTVLYLKRAGIGYTYNLQPKEANVYLRLACDKDSTDLEVLSLLARNYDRLKDYKKSASYYRQIIRNVEPFVWQSATTYIFLAESLKSDGQYTAAIEAYLKSQKTRSDPSITMIIANLYDEKLNDVQNAILYYEQFLDYYQDSKMPYRPDYVESVRKRLALLKSRSTAAN